MRSLGISKIDLVQLLILNVCTKYHGNPSTRCGDSSIKVTHQLTETVIVTLKADSNPEHLLVPVFQTWRFVAFLCPISFQVQYLCICTVIMDKTSILKTLFPLGTTLLLYSDTVWGPQTHVHINPKQCPVFTHFIYWLSWKKLDPSIFYTIYPVEECRRVGRNP